MLLTSLANVRGWVSSQLSQTGDDLLLTRLINEASRMTLNYLQRPELGLTTITETQSGKNTKKIKLRNWPVIAVNSLTIDTVSIPPAPNSIAYGFFLEPVFGGLAGKPQNLGVSGAWSGFGGGYAVGFNANGMAAFAPSGYNSGSRPFTNGLGNIAINYSYGYTVQNEPQTIPSVSTYTITPFGTYGSWSQDLGVSYAAGGALTAVSANPTTGQYVAPNLSGDSPTLYYTFAAADAGKAVLLNYNFVPYDVEQAVIELVGERYKYKNRIGQQSQTLGGQETASYLVKDPMTASILGRLNPYRLVWGG